MEERIADSPFSPRASRDPEGAAGLSAGDTASAGLLGFVREIARNPGDTLSPVAEALPEDVEPGVGELPVEGECRLDRAEPHHLEARAVDE